MLNSVAFVCLTLLHPPLNELNELQPKLITAFKVVKVYRQFPRLLHSDFLLHAFSNVFTKRSLMEINLVPVGINASFLINMNLLYTIEFKTVAAL